MGVVCACSKQAGSVASKENSTSTGLVVPDTSSLLEAKRDYQKRYSHHLAVKDFSIAITPGSWIEGSSSEDINKFYKFESLIGQGYTSKVKRAAMISNPTLVYAVKTISRTHFEDKDGKYFRAEMNILKFLDHPNIIRFFETFQDKVSYHLVLELCTKKDLVHLVERAHGLSEEQAKSCFYQAVYAINYLQHLGICHRDIKLDNFLICSPAPGSDIPQIKLIDFGFAQYFREGKLRTMVGTPWYVAPEILDKSKPYTFKCDNWSLGVMLYMMLFAKPPFKGNNNAELYAQISNKDIDYSEPQFQKLSSELVKLLKVLLCKDPSKRLTLPQVLQSHWFDSSILQLHQTWDQQQMISVIQKLREKKRLSKFENHIRVLMVKLFSDHQSVRLATNLFRQCDTNNRGILAEEEIRLLFDKAKIQTSTEEVREIVTTVSADKLEVLAFSEFLVAVIDAEFFADTVK